jgi:hypothetical protein
LSGSPRAGLKEEVLLLNCLNVLFVAIGPADVIINTTALRLFRDWCCHLAGTNSGPTDHSHPRNSPLLRVCTVPSVPATLKCIPEVMFCEWSAPPQLCQHGGTFNRGPETSRRGPSQTSMVGGVWQSCGFR